MASANDISEITVIVRYRDEVGEYSHGQSVIQVACTDGSTRHLDPELTTVFNFWGNYMASKDVCKFKDRPHPVRPGSRFFTREEASLQFGLVALRGLDFRQSIQLLQFDSDKGHAVPVDLTNAEIEMNIYAPAKHSFDLIMSHPDCDDMSVSIDLTDSENLDFHLLTSDLERETFKNSFFERHKSEFEKLMGDQIAKRM